MSVRILVADDERAVRSALRLLLTQNGNVSVEEAVDSVDLLARLDGEAPDILLLDWELPGQIQSMLKRVRENFPGIKVIALSSSPEARRAAISAGADVFVCKEEPPEVLLEAVNKMVDLK